MQRFDRQTYRTRPGITAWLGLFAVLFLQLQLASHLNVDHESLGDYGDTCEVCLKLHSTGSAPAADQPMSTLPPAARVPLAAPVDRIALRHAARPCARAPPVA